MDLYSIALFLHIVGALGLFAALALEWGSLYNLRRAYSMSQFWESARLLGGLRLVGGPSALTLLVTGFYLGAARWGGQGWIVLSLLGLVLMAVIGATVTGRRLGAIMKAAPDDGQMPANLLASLRDPVFLVSAWLRTGLGLGVIFLMSIKPGAAAAALVLVVAASAGLAVGLVARGSMPTQPHSARS
jgi:hypothetical protein